MIYGIGVDVVKIARIEASLARFGEKFCERIFTSKEINYAKSRGDQARIYALGFAAKEAAWKALSPRRGHGIGWHDFEVVRERGGRPNLILHGEAIKLLNTHTKNKPEVHLSLSDDDGFALAFVVLSIS